MGKIGTGICLFLHWVYSWTPDWESEIWVTGTGLCITKSQNGNVIDVLLA